MKSSTLTCYFSTLFTLIATSVSWEEWWCWFWCDLLELDIIIKELEKLRSPWYPSARERLLCSLLHFLGRSSNVAFEKRYSSFCYFVCFCFVFLVFLHHPPHPHTHLGGGVIHFTFLNFCHLIPVGLIWSFQTVTWWIPTGGGRRGREAVLWKFGQRGWRGGWRGGGQRGWEAGTKESALHHGPRPPTSVEAGQATAQQPQFGCKCCACVQGDVSVA